MKILGINAFGHETSAALVIDGRLVAAVEEERLNREKKTRKFPYLSIAYCLEQAGITLADLDSVTFGCKSHLWLTHRLLYHQLRYFPYALGEIAHAARQFDKFILLKRNLRKALRADVPIYLARHHDAHIGSTYLVSPFDESAILTVDGLGEYESSVWATGHGNVIRRLRHVNFPHSLGMMYACISYFVGYNPGYDEGKVMGLSAWGDRDAFYKDFKKLVTLKRDGTFELDLSYFMYHRVRDRWVSEKFYRTFGPRRQRGEEINDRHRAVAAAAQRVLEDTILHMTEHLHHATRQTTLCIAGGVALNSVANGLILEQGLFKDIFIQPASGDAGIPIGSAFYYYNVVKGRPRRYVANDTFLGPQYGTAAIVDALRTHGLPVRKSEDVAAETARLLASKKVIGLFQGRMEFGPRALGNRSILADPRHDDMKDIINLKVKHREAYRPFAPAILHERCREFFENDYTSPYMLLVYKVRPEKKHEIPAVVHADDTGRIQTVVRDDNPRYYDIIKEFEKLTGIPVILNTSFNVDGEPIVCSPDDAVRCFLGTQLDALVMDDYVVSKDELVPPALVSA
jgi:carbamoyltransferase